MIEFRTLGTIDLRGPQGVAVRSVLSQPKRLALLAYLVLDWPGDLHRRDTLIGIFWPEAEDERARAILRKSLHYLRRSLGEDVLVGHGEEAVGVRRDSLRCDALEFERAMEGGDGGRALELYGGDLLDGLFVSEAPEFERWLDRRRWELRDRATQAAWEMAEGELEAGNPVGAAHWGRRAFAIDAFGEAGLRRLLALLDRLGDRAGAILAYEEFARRLEAEEVEPSPETQALIAGIRAREEPAPLEETFDTGEEPAAEGRVGPAPDIPTAPVDRVAGRGPRSRLALRAAALAGLLIVGLLTLGALAARSGDTLVERGVLEKNFPILLADFRSSDADLGRALTEAFRIDLSQSRVVRLIEPIRVQEAVVRMERDPDASLDARAARELAVREGFPAVIAGEIHEAGNGYVLSAALLSAADGAVLASHRTAARDSSRILAAIDELSDVLRRRIGESRTQIRGEPPLEQVTTSNLHALRSFSLALRVMLERGEWSRGVALLEETIALDTAFAAAHATLGAVLGSLGQERTRAVEALTRAYRHRDRLPERERLWISAWYYWQVEGRYERAARTYESILELEADRAPASDLADLHGELAALLLELRDPGRAEEMAARAVVVDSSRHWHIATLTEAQALQGRFETAEATLARHLERAPDHPSLRNLMGHLKASRGDYAGAQRAFRELRETERDDLRQVQAAIDLAALVAVQGRVKLATAYLEEAMEMNERRGLPGEYLRNAAWAARLEAEAGEPSRALARVDAALALHRLSSIPPLDRPYLELVEVYAAAGVPERSRHLLEDLRSLFPEGVPVETSINSRLALGSLDRARGALALAEGRAAAAVDAFQRSDTGRCRVCSLPGLARAYDRWGRADSAVAVYERYLDTPEATRLWSGDAFYLGPTYERLGQLYELKGDRARAAAYFQRFVELWADADPELQPRVRAARDRLSAPGSG